MKSLFPMLRDRILSRPDVFSYECVESRVPRPVFHNAVLGLDSGLSGQVVAWLQPWTGRIAGLESLVSTESWTLHVRWEWFSDAKHMRLRDHHCDVTSSETFDRLESAEFVNTVASVEILTNNRVLTRLVIVNALHASFLRGFAGRTHIVANLTHFAIKTKKNRAGYLNTSCVVNFLRLLCASEESFRLKSFELSLGEVSNIIRCALSAFLTKKCADTLLRLRTEHFDGDVVLPVLEELDLTNLNFMTYSEQKSRLPRLKRVFARMRHSQFEDLRTFCERFRNTDYSFEHAPLLNFECILRPIVDKPDQLEQFLSPKQRGLVTKFKGRLTQEILDQGMFPQLRSALHLASQHFDAWNISHPTLNDLDVWCRSSPLPATVREIVTHCPMLTKISVGVDEGDERIYSDVVEKLGWAVKMCDNVIVFEKRVQ